MDTDFRGTVLIVGVGLLGGSLGLGLQKKCSPSTKIWGADIDAESLRLARERGAIHTGTTDWQEAAAFADLLVFCTPPAHVIGHVRLACELAKPGAVVTDVGSVKGAVADAAENASNYVGCHPMAGSEQSGIAFARADLFHEAAWAVCPTPYSSPAAIDTVSRLGAAVGGRILSLSPPEHDAMVAVTSHVPHALAAALMRHAGSLRDMFPLLPALSAGSFRDATRVAASSPDLWRDVCLSNASAVRASLHAMQQQLSALDDALAAEEGEAVRAFFEDAQRAKAHWNTA